MYGNPYQPWVNGPQMYQQANPPVYEEVEGPESIAYIQMMPNDRRVVFDKHRDRFYTIETDAACQKSVHAYDFVPADDAQHNAQPSSGLEDKLSVIEKRLDEIEQLVLQ